MRTTIAFEGFPEMILEKAVELGLARSKTDALRLGILALNKEYNLIKDLELELVERKLRMEEKELKMKNKKYLSEKEALKKVQTVKILSVENWRLGFKPNWDIHFKKFDKSIQQIILKKFEKMKKPIIGRGLSFSRYQVEEVGQYRIAFIQDEPTKTKNIHFVGNHKQYEKWYKTLF